jgi:hypothetical protein
MPLRAADLIAVNCNRVPTDDQRLPPGSEPAGSHPASYGGDVHSFQHAPLGVRWTIGDVSPQGFEALGFSIHAAVRLFGPDNAYTVCVNTISLDEARRRAGAVPDLVTWCAAPLEPPAVLAPFLDDQMSEGTAWKFMPLSLFPSRFELALDNDVILWQLPNAIERWLRAADPVARVIAADVVPAHGEFSAICGAEPRNSGIRGTGPGFDFAGALERVLARRPAALRSELDEQGLQIAALSLDRAPLVVTTEEVSICSPFPPHDPELGSCGAHFVGLNVRNIPWRFYERNAAEVRLEHWASRRSELRQRIGLCH